MYNKQYTIYMYDLRRVKIMNMNLRITATNITDNRILYVDDVELAPSETFLMQPPDTPF